MVWWRSEWTWPLEVAGRVDFTLGSGWAIGLDSWQWLGEWTSPVAVARRVDLTRGSGEASGLDPWQWRDEWTWLLAVAGRVDLTRGSGGAETEGLLAQPGLGRGTLGAREITDQSTMDCCSNQPHQEKMGANGITIAWKSLSLFILLDGDAQTVKLMENNYKENAIETRVVTRVYKLYWFYLYNVHIL